MPAITVINHYPNFRLLTPAVNTALQYIASGEQQKVKNILLIATDDTTLNRLKKQYFGDDVLTDTISFNYNEPGLAIEGEIYLSIDRIRENAQKYGNNFKNELMLVIIHSLLHLMGYDDVTAADQRRMAERQHEYLEKVQVKYLFRNLKQAR